MERSLNDLSKYRFETSLEDIDEIKSVVILDGFDSSKHSGIIAYFNQNYVKTGIFPKEISKIIKAASENREKADYHDFFVASKEEAENQIERAREFSAQISEYLKSRGII